MRVTCHPLLVSRLCRNDEKPVQNVHVPLAQNITEPSHQCGGRSPDNQILKLSLCHRPSWTSLTHVPTLPQNQTSVTLRFLNLSYVKLSQHVSKSIAIFSGYARVYSLATSPLPLERYGSTSTGRKKRPLRARGRSEVLKRRTIQSLQTALPSGSGSSRQATEDRRRR